MIEDPPFSSEPVTLALREPAADDLAGCRPQDLAARGEFAAAAHLARDQGRLADAAGWYSHAKMHYEAAACHVGRKAPRCALEELMRIRPTEACYRTACVRAIRLARRLGTVTYSFVEFVEPFINTPDLHSRELQALQELAETYQEQELGASALDAWDRLAACCPTHEMAVARAEVLRAQMPQMMLQAAQQLSCGELEGLDRISSLPPPGGSLSPPARSAAPPRPQGGSWGACIPELERGMLVAGRYRVVGRLGRGGMADVYRVDDLELGQSVALKLFAPLADPDSLASRFRQELLIARSLTHPNIVRVYDLGTHLHSRFLTMELLCGVPLSTAIRQAGRLRQDQAIDYLLQACDGLAAIHAQNVVHRDVKPDNLFVTNEGVLKIMDFGLARTTTAPRTTMAGFLAGSPAYMSPEQIGDFSSVTHLADLYSLGVTGYEMLAGQLPFDCADVVPLLLMQASASPAPIQARVPGLDPRLAAAVMKLLEKDPSARFQSCSEFAASLRAVSSAS